MSMQALTAASQSMARMRTMQSSRTQMQGTANVLRTESKLDDPVNGNQAKLDKADELEKKSSNLMGDLMGEIADVNETLKPDEDAKAEEAKKEEAAKNPPIPFHFLMLPPSSSAKNPVPNPPFWRLSLIKRMAARSQANQLRSLQNLRQLHNLQLRKKRNEGDQAVCGLGCPRFNKQQKKSRVFII